MRWLLEVLSKPKNQVTIMKVTAFLNASLFVVVAVQYGCGRNMDDSMVSSKGNSPAQVRSVSPSLEPIVSKFEKEFNVTITYPVHYFTTTNKVVGRCTTWTNGAREIVIDTKYASEANEYQLEQVVYHELGHCELRREHNDARVKFKDLSDDWPASIMKSSTFDDDESTVYAIKREYYIKELKGE